MSRWAITFGVLLLIGAGVGWAGPFGSYLNHAPLVRFAFWMTAIPLIGLVADLAIRAVAQSDLGSSWPEPLQSMAGAAIAGIPGVFIVIGLQTILAKGNSPSSPLSLVSVAQLYGSVTMIIAAIGIPLNVIQSRHERTVEGALHLAPAPSQDVMAASSAPIVSSAPSSPFLQRLPARLGSGLLYIAAEDHYLRVTTNLGSDLLLLRLSDAIAELGPALGQQVHRSYWVARSAVAEVRRQDGRVSLLLNDGTVIPVSRSYLGALLGAGWPTGQ